MKLMFTSNSSNRNKANLTKTIKGKSKLIILSLLLLMLLQQSSQSESNSYRSDSDAYLNCFNRIIDPDHKLTDTEKTTLCSMMNYDHHKVFLVFRIIDDLPNTSQRKIDRYYDEENEDYLENLCSSINDYNFNKYCNKLVGVTIYYEARKIRLSVRNSLNNIIPNKYRIDVINGMIVRLQKDHIFRAFKRANDMIREEIERFEDGAPTYSSESSNDYGAIFFFFVFILILLFIIYNAVGNGNKKSYIHDHFNDLSKIINNDIKTKSPPITTTDKCLLCLESFNTLLPKKENEDPTKIKSVLLYSCGHYFHQQCIKLMIKTNGCDQFCMMCDEPTGMVKEIFSLNQVNNSELSQHVDEKNILNIINNYNNIYGEQTLKDYYYNYESSDIKIMKSLDLISWVHNKEYADYCFEQRRIERENNHRSNSSSNKSKNFSTSGGSYESNNSRKSSNSFDSSSGGFTTSGGNY